MMLTATFPIEPFNSMVREGTAGDTIQTILSEIKPESCYFVEQDGKRTAVLIINVQDQSRIPFYAEPFFLKFDAKCEFRIAMTPDDLDKAGLEKLGKMWR
jgi:hypothetical protein